MWTKFCEKSQSAMKVEQTQKIAITNQEGTWIGPPLSLTSLVHIGLTQDFHVTQNQNNATVIYSFMWIFSCKNVLTFTWLSFISSNTYFYFLKLALKNIGEMNGYSYQMPNKLLKSSITFINKYQNTLVFILKLQCL